MTQASQDHHSHPLNGHSRPVNTASARHETDCYQQAIYASLAISHSYIRNAALLLLCKNAALLLLYKECRSPQPLPLQHLSFSPSPQRHRSKIKSQRPLYKKLQHNSRKDSTFTMTDYYFVNIWGQQPAVFFPGNPSFQQGYSGVNSPNTTANYYNDVSLERRLPSQWIGLQGLSSFSLLRIPMPLSTTHSTACLRRDRTAHTDPSPNDVPHPPAAWLPKPRALLQAGWRYVTAMSSFKLCSC
jgi:hypothetical protein